jgi:hypothetical protein
MGCWGAGGGRQLGKRLDGYCTPCSLQRAIPLLGLRAGSARLPQLQLAALAPRPPHRSPAPGHVTVICDHLTIQHN